MRSYAYGASHGRGSFLPCCTVRSAGLFISLRGREREEEDEEEEGERMQREMRGAAGTAVDLSRRGTTAAAQAQGVARGEIMGGSSPLPVPGPVRGEASISIQREGVWLAG